MIAFTTEMTPKIDENGKAFSLRSRDYKDPQCVVYRKTGHPQNKDMPQGWEETEKSDTLNIYDQGEIRTPTLILENHPADSRVKVSADGMCQTLSSRMGTGGGNVPLLLESNQNHATVQEDISTALPASMGEGGGYIPMVTEETNMIVRRLTPLECERLQGFPDGWTDIGEWTDSKGKKHKDADSPRYKALGNSIACPYWAYLLKRISAQYERPATLGSLFDGIGGFPLCWVRVNGSNSVLWTSEIEEFPIAVVKKHFGDEEHPGDIQRYL